jgi:hypothetical protein
MRMRTLRPSMLQRTHDPNDAEEKHQKENKKQIVAKYAEFPLFFSLFLTDLT